jgi:RNA polymerase sigma-70 factor, ECF subfamily
MTGSVLPAERRPEAAEEPRPGFAEHALPLLDAVYRFALRLAAGNAAEADDVTQETFLRAYRHWHTFRPGSSVRAWLFTIARNAFLRGRERQTRRAEILESELAHTADASLNTALLAASGSDDPEQAFFASFIEEDVIRAIEQLPHDFREVVVMSDVEGLNYAEIAEVVGVPLGTVKSRLFRGRRQLQRLLYDYAVELGHIRGGHDGA